MTWKDSLAYIDEDTSKLNWLNASHDRLIYTAPDECENINLVYDSITARVDDEKYVSISENMKGTIHYVRSDFGNAIEHFLNALHYF